jgi:dTDP-glucose 4,6-dehydratase
MSSRQTIVITGGSGFIGSHVVRRFLQAYPFVRVVNLDALTYAGNPENLADVERNANYFFRKADIRFASEINSIFDEFQPDGIIHLAAESHVDRSIAEPSVFVQTNVLGTANLLNACLEHWKDLEQKRFLHVSTDEVFGSLGAEGFFTEATPYSPRSPYSASKAASDHLVRAYFHTYGLPIVISNCSNNFGSHQFPEKLIPLVINNIKECKPIPVYGTGENVRDWLWVEDHARGLESAYFRGVSGESYCFGGSNEWKNIDLVRLICRLTDRQMGRQEGESESLITFVRDRPGHDHRYAIDSAKAERVLGWRPSRSFESALEEVIRWYLTNSGWLQNVTSGAYRDYYRKHYNRD